LYLLLFESSAFAFTVLPIQEHSKRQTHRVVSTSDHLSMCIGTKNGFSETDANPNIGSLGDGNAFKASAEFPKTTTFNASLLVQPLRQASWRLGLAIGYW
jgi:hypothetical protein